MEFICSRLHSQLIYNITGIFLPVYPHFCKSLPRILLSTSINEEELLEINNFQLHCKSLFPLNRQPKQTVSSRHLEGFTPLTVHPISSCQCILAHFKADGFGLGSFGTANNQRALQDTYLPWLSGAKCSSQMRSR